MMTQRSSRIRGHQMLVVLFFGLFVAGCEPASQAFLSRGIGASLPPTQTDMTNTSKLQRQYFNYLCQEAGLGAPGPKGTCHLGATDATSWTLIVQQGLNDIDRRCDAYLQWLDNRKRANGPLINQIASIGAATTGIMGVTGATTEALTIAALAFGLASQSVENYNGLLLNVDTSTVNSVVLNSRHTFRKNIQGNQFSNRPEAEYVLRSYLRLCLPFAIETNINDYSTFGSAGIKPTVENTINRTPVAGTPLKPTPPPTTTLKNPIGQVENNLSLSTAKNIQSALCVGADGNFGSSTTSATRSAIKQFQQALGYNQTGVIDNNAQKTKLVSALPCDLNYSKNAYEKYSFYGQDYDVVSDRLEGLKADLEDIYNLTLQQGATPPQKVRSIVESNAMETDRIGPNIREVVLFVGRNNATLKTKTFRKDGTISFELEKALDDFAV